MTFGGKVEHRPRLMLGHQARYQGAITDVATHEMVAQVALQADQVLAVAGVSQLVKLTTASSWCDSQSMTKFEPMKPASPVTKIVILAVSMYQLASATLRR